MRIRRLAPGLVALLALHPAIAHATTAASLAQRIHLDGNPGDYDADEWILDATSTFPERADDSRWGNDNDIARVALTWDAARLYLAVEFSARASGALVMIANGPGGLASLDAAGEFRRAIDPPFEPNLLLFAQPASPPRVARADATHPFALLDEATVPAVVRAQAGALEVLEAWIPWTVLDVSRPLFVAVVLTGGIASGAGDAAPDTRGVLSSDRYARAVVDRWFAINIDADADGGADLGVAPRTAGGVAPDTVPAVAAGDEALDVVLSQKVFAPDRGEAAAFTLRSGGGGFTEASGRCVIHAMDGRRIRSIAIPQSAAASEITVSWDGRDDSGRVCDGGVYVAAFELDFATTAGGRQHAARRVGVALAR